MKADIPDKVEIRRYDGRVFYHAPQLCSQLGGYSTARRLEMLKLELDHVLKLILAW